MRLGHPPIEIGRQDRVERLPSRNLDGRTLDFRRDRRRDDPHAGARVDEGLQLGGRHGSAADEDDVPSSERQKQGKQVTHKNKKPGKRWASRAGAAVRAGALCRGDR